MTFPIGLNGKKWQPLWPDGPENFGVKQLRAEGILCVSVLSLD